MQNTECEYREYKTEEDSLKPFSLECKMQITQINNGHKSQFKIKEFIYLLKKAIRNKWT